MRAPRSLVLTLTIAVTATMASRVASAEEPEPPARAPRSGVLPVVVGGVTALVPIGIGAASMSHVGSLGNKNVGFVFAGAGLIAAPLFAHGVNGEWGRGALFCLPSLGLEAGMIGIVAARPDAVFSGTTVTRTTFVGLFTASFFIATAGIVDAALVGDRDAGHGPFGSREPASIHVTSIAPGAGDSPWGLTLSLSM